MSKLIWSTINKSRVQVYLDDEESPEYTVQYLPIQRLWRAYFKHMHLSGEYNFRSKEAGQHACQRHHDFEQAWKSLMKAARG